METQHWDSFGVLSNWAVRALCQAFLSWPNGGSTILGIRRLAQTVADESEDAGEAVFAMNILYLLNHVDEESLDGLLRQWAVNYLKSFNQGRAFYEVLLSQTEVTGPIMEGVPASVA